MTLAANLPHLNHSATRARTFLHLDHLYFVHLAEKKEKKKKKKKKKTTTILLLSRIMPKGFQILKIPPTFEEALIK
jgi:hypothetical protein